MYVRTLMSYDEEWFSVPFHFHDNGLDPSYDIQVRLTPICSAVQCSAVSCVVMLRHIISYHIISYHIKSHHVITLHHVTIHDMTLHDMIQQRERENHLI